MHKEISPVEALNLFMCKLHGAPLYTCLSKFGKSHKPWYRYNASAMEEEVIGMGHSKRSAKQVVAAKLLERLSLRGYMVPSQFVSPTAAEKLAGHPGLPTGNFVVLVKEVCQKYRLAQVRYEVTPPTNNHRLFTVRASFGHTERVASGASKRIAYQLAAEQMYKYLHAKINNTEF